MIQEPESFEVESQPRPEDKIESVWADRTRARDFSTVEVDGEFLYSTVKLENMGRKWMIELENPLRTQRNKNEINILCDLIAFEIAYRKGELRKLENMWGDEL